jgi:hypothetical protein
MTLLTVVRDVCAVVGVTLPGSVFAGVQANRTMQEMVALANEMAQRIAYDTRDWGRLKTTHTIAGDGVFVPPQPDPAAVFTGTTAFNLPQNYKRMLLTSNVWRTSSTQFPMSFVPDTDDWIKRRLEGNDSAFGEWTIIGGQMHIYPIMPVGVSAYFGYLDKNCIALAGGGFGDRFMADGDSFVLDERCLTLGMVWQWKAQKGSPYAEDMSTYGDALTAVMGRDSPAPIIIGRRPISHSGRGEYGPWLS